MSHIHQKPLYIQPCFGGKGMKGGRCLGVPLLIFNSPLIECNLTQGREEEKKTLHANFFLLLYTFKVNVKRVTPF